MDDLARLAHHHVLPPAGVVVRSQRLAQGRQDYRSNGVFPGLQLAHDDWDKRPGVLDGVRQG